MSSKTLKFKIRGVSPLLMHNGQLANPLNKFSQQMKQISGKRNKTDADFMELAKLEWYGSLYLQDGAPCVPGEVLEAAFIEAARKSRKGKQAQASVICPNNYPLIYKGTKDLEKMWENEDFRLTVGVRIQRAKIMRTRPQFKEWALEFDVVFDDSMLNEKEVRDIVKLAGEIVGLMDWRPKFGRFNVE